ncbi:MAG: threonyl-tRNA synthetase editing domain-containing protein [Gammaproteobacteria bacterium]|nr:threonyl-tRNA synthetase editing domain-containing protein [Gammaproteobacteria bacterium]
MFLAPRFRFRPFIATLDGAETDVGEKTVQDAAVIFVHAEESDTMNSAGLLTKLVKNVKWLANKRGIKNVVLHSFTHLSESKSSPEFAESFLIQASDRLSSAGYRVDLTPFGYSCEWELAVHGEPLAKVFKSL